MVGYQWYRDVAGARGTATRSQQRRRSRQSAAMRRHSHLYGLGRCQVFPVTWPLSLYERPAAARGRHDDDRLAASLSAPCWWRAAERRRRRAVHLGVGHLDSVFVVTQPPQLADVAAQTPAPADALTEQTTERHAELGTERRIENKVDRAVDDDQQVEHVAGDFQQIQLLQQTNRLLR